MFKAPASRSQYCWSRPLTHSMPWFHAIEATYKSLYMITVTHTPWKSRSEWERNPSKNNQQLPQRNAGWYICKRVQRNQHCRVHSPTNDKACSIPKELFLPLRHSLFGAQSPRCTAPIHRSVHSFSGVLVRGHICIPHVMMQDMLMGPGRHPVVATGGLEPDPKAYDKWRLVKHQASDNRAKTNSQNFRPYWLHLPQTGEYYATSNESHLVNITSGPGFRKGRMLSRGQAHACYGTRW